MSVFRESQTQSWYVNLRHEGARRRLKSPENSRTGAQAYELYLRQRLARGDNIQSLGQIARPPEEQPRAAITYKELAEEWLRTHVAVNTKPSVQQTYGCTLKRHLVPFFGPVKVTGIDGQQIERYKAKARSDGLAGKTINCHLMILHSSLAGAKERGYIDRVPEFKWMKAQTPAPVFMSRDEAQTLLAWVYEPLWATMILVALRTGMRIGEILALQWEDVDLETECLTVCRNLSLDVVVAPKNYRSRQFPLPSEVIDVLRNWKRQQEARDGPVFTRNGRRVTYARARRALRRICRLAGITPYSWHKLRHTFATLTVAAGAPLRAVQHVLGHSTIHMTERYAHVTDESLKRTMSLLGNPALKNGQSVGSRSSSPISLGRDTRSENNDNHQETRDMARTEWVERMTGQ